MLVGFSLLVLIVVAPFALLLFVPKLVRESNQAWDGPLAVVMVVRNAQEFIKPKIEAILEQLGPEDQLFVIDDGSDDDSPVLLKSLQERHAPQLQLRFQDHAKGKAGCLSDLATETLPEWLVLTDVRQTWQPSVLKTLRQDMSSPSVGVISGVLQFSGVKQSVWSRYWQGELLLRHFESRRGRLIGATGALYALRRVAFHPLPEGTVLDDVAFPLLALNQGFDAVLCDEAVCVDQMPLNLEKEQLRKRRTLAGNLQMLFKPHLYRWHQNALTAWQFIAHKFARLFLPIPFFLIFWDLLRIFDEQPLWFLLMGLLLLADLFYRGPISNLLRMLWVVCLAWFDFLTGRSWAAWGQHHAN